MSETTITHTEDEQIFQESHCEIDDIESLKTKNERVLQEGLMRNYARTIECLHSDLKAAEAKIERVRKLPPLLINANYGWAHFVLKSDVNQALTDKKDTDHE